MRHIAILITFVCAVTVIQAQVIGNNGFESWDTINNYEDPVGWSTSNDLSTPLVGPSVTKDTSAYADSFSVKISSYVGGFVPETYAGLLTNGSADYDSLGTNGPPISYKPERLSGYYKFSSNAADSGLIVLYFNRYSNVLGRDELVAGGSMKMPPVANWTYFEIDIQNEFQNSPDPDNYVIIATSTRDISNPEESTLWLDELEFGGVLSVADPELMAEVTVYPNPATEIVTIDAGVNRFSDIRVFNSAGALVKNDMLHDTNVGKYQIQVSHLPVGTYYLHATTDDGRAWSQVINVIR